MKKKMNILVADDLEENRYMFESILKGKDYNVLLASNGKEALGVLKTQHADLIISDILMPEMDGFQFCRECQTNVQLKDIPFIFITATYTDKKDEEFALSLGARHFITKPLNPEDIMEKIKEAIQADKKGKQRQSFKPALREESAFLKQYSQRVAEKLEHTVNKLEKEMAERKKAEETLNMVQEGTSYTVGTDFFRSLVRHIANALDVRYVFLAKIMGSNLEQMDTFVVWDNTDFAENFSYDLEHTPCANVVDQGFCSYPNEVQKKFPKDQLLIDMGVEGYIGTPLHDSKGNVLGLLAVMDDKPIKSIFRVETTMKIFATRAATELEREKAGEELQESESKLRAIFDQTFQFMGLLSIEGTLLKANRTALEFAGIEAAAVIGKPFWETVWWRHSAEEQEKIKKAIKKAASGEFIRYETTHPNRSGAIRVVDFSLKPILDADDRVMFLNAEGTDITERKQAEAALRNSEAELRQQKAVLEQKNAALSEILEHIEREKQQIKDNVIANIDQVIMPSLEKLKLKGGVRKHVNMIENYMEDMASSFGKKISEKSVKLTSREIEICSMVKTGLTNKETANLLSISLETVEKHRRHIRKKLGISKKDINLTTYLKTL